MDNNNTMAFWICCKTFIRVGITGFIAICIAIEIINTKN